MAALLDKNKIAESAPASVPQGDLEEPRRSRRLTTQKKMELTLRSELDQCRTELLTKTQGSA